MAYFAYDAYGHGDAPTEPLRGGDIIGLELEFNPLDYTELNYLIESEVIGTPDSPAETVQLEYEADGAVEFEAIFNADSVAGILARVRQFEDLGAETDNHEGTSAHVHISREYLAGLDISAREYLRAAEAIAPLIYAVSGRDGSQWRRWCDSYAHQEESIPHACGVADRLDYAWWSGERYRMVNLTNCDTIEVRGFSNAYNFDYGLIKCYIGIAHDLIPDIAAFVSGSSTGSYADNANDIMKICTRFLETQSGLAQRLAGDLVDPEAQRRRQVKRDTRAALRNHRSTRRGVFFELEEMEPAATAREYLRRFQAFPAEIQSAFNGVIDLNNLEPFQEFILAENERQLLAALFR